MALTNEEIMAIDQKIAAWNARPRKIGGLYLDCFHGRYLVKQDMDDWGFQGPRIGPLKWVHLTYASDVKIAFENEEDAKAFGCDQFMTMIDFVDGLFPFGGAYYGDISTYVETGEE